MSMTVTAKFSVPSEMLALIASDVGDAGVLDVGDRTGLSTGDGDELSSGVLAYPTLSLEILVGTSNQTHGDGLAPVEGTRLGGDAQAPGEITLSVGRDAVVLAGAEALLFLDPAFPIEWSAPVIPNTLVPTELASKAVGAVVPIEASASTRLDWPAPSELTARRRRRRRLRVDVPVANEIRST
jgi:hypothetical protein